MSDVRIVLSMMPQKQWLSAETPLALLGLLVIVLFYRAAKECEKIGGKKWVVETLVLHFLTE